MSETTSLRVENTLSPAEKDTSVANTSHLIYYIARLCRVLLCQNFGTEYSCSRNFSPTFFGKSDIYIIVNRCFIDVIPVNRFGIRKVKKTTR